jgi:hypothetical protein
MPFAKNAKKKQNPTIPRPMLEHSRTNYLIGEPQFIITSALMKIHQENHFLVLAF